MQKNKKLVFSLDSHDFEWSYFSTGGPGGQNQNRKLNGVRCTHKPSGASADSRNFKSQGQNKESAFKKCCESRRFQIWAKVQASRLAGIKTPEEIVDEMFEYDSDFKLEVKDSDGKWVEISLEDFLATAS